MQPKNKKEDLLLPPRKREHGHALHQNRPFFAESVCPEKNVVMTTSCNSGRIFINPSTVSSSTMDNWSRQLPTSKNAVALLLAGNYAAAAVAGDSQGPLAVFPRLGAHFVARCGKNRGEGLLQVRFASVLPSIVFALLQVVG